MESKKCPILMLQKDYPILCMEGGCAWFNIKYMKCSILDIALSINSIEGNFGND